MTAVQDLYSFVWVRFHSRKEYEEPAKAEDIFFNMGVNIIWFEDYDELPGMVLELLK